MCFKLVAILTGVYLPSNLQRQLQCFLGCRSTGGTAFLACFSKITTSDWSSSEILLLCQISTKFYISSFLVLDDSGGRLSAVAGAISNCEHQGEILDAVNTLLFYNLYCKSSLVKTLFVHGVLFSICSYNSSPRLSINMSLRKCWETHFTPSLHRNSWEIKLKSTSPVAHMWPTEPS